MNTFYAMMMDAQITLPFYEVALMLIGLTFCFLLHSYKFGLMASFIFVFRMGWLFFRANFGLDNIGYIVAYCVFGLLVFFFACYQFFIGES
mgnify:CR=1 FL=1